MNEAIRNDILRELECLNNTCIVGDPTAVIFNILKKTPDMYGMCKHLGFAVPEKDKPVVKKSNLSMFDQLLASGTRWSG